MKSAPDISALIRLLDDPDEHIFELVSTELVTQGPSVIPQLEESWEHDCYGELFLLRVENLIHTIQYNDTKNALLRWIDGPYKDLLEGALIIARYNYPHLDEAKFREELAAIRKNIWLELNEHQTAYERARIFNKVFYGKLGFIGDKEHYYDPSNSYINVVLERKKGNPLSLSLIYSIIAQSLDLPIYGVNLPNHFVLAYMDENNLNGIFDDNNTSGVLFYINAFSNGELLGPNDIRTFLEGANKEYRREYYEPCSNSAIIARMTTNLITCYQQAGNPEKVQELINLRHLFDAKL